MKPHWIDELAGLRACPDAIEWCQGYPSLAAAWPECKRGDWMAWLAGRLCRTMPQRRRLVSCLADIAAEALVHVPAGENRPRIAVETARRFSRGEATVEECKAAGASAWAGAEAAAGASAWAGAEAARAAAWAAWIVEDAGNIALSATKATTSAADAATKATTSAADAARDASRATWATWATSLATSADIVRRHYPKAPKLRRRS